MTETNPNNGDITDKISEPEVSTKIEEFETRLPKAYLHFCSEAKKTGMTSLPRGTWSSYLNKVLELAYARFDEYDRAIKVLREESAERKGEKIGRLDLKEALDKYSEGKLCRKYSNIIESKLKKIVEESDTPLLQKAHSSLIEYKSTYPSLSSAFDPILESLVLDDRFIERHKRFLNSLDRLGYLCEGGFISDKERWSIAGGLYLVASVTEWDFKTCSYKKIDPGIPPS